MYKLDAFICCQVQKLQQVMRSKQWGDIQIGSVEEFQGQEKMIIIVSTVRSNPEFLSLDMDFKLGFLRNPKVIHDNVGESKWNVKFPLKPS